MAFLVKADVEESYSNSTRARGAYFAIPSKYTSTDAKQLRTQVRRALQEGARELVVDCSGWSQLDLSMLSSLIQCAAACNEYGASLEVANMTGEIRENVRDLQLAGRLGLDD